MEEEIVECSQAESKSLHELASTLDRGYESEGELDTRKLVTQMNRKKKKSGGFQSMGLSYPVFKGVMKKGYKVPTPIQRKCIPVIMEGKDVVAMARTGSGKTAAFLIPLFEKLQTRSGKAGARGLLLAPTRELALQTMQFIKELGRFSSLKSACVLGGDKMDDQFEALHGNPDIIVGTPGRLMHVLIEMNLRLSSVEYVVFDEADRLFELGFQDQLNEIISRLPSERQTLLFSATLPKQLVEFAKAGLNDPTLIRLDVDSKLSEQLKMTFLQVRNEDKPAVLVHMLRTIVKPHEQTVVFAATKHHVEYLRLLLSRCGIVCSYVYSSLDQTERKINIGKFRNKKTMILLVTDVAARGLDIPMLDNAINFNFPAKSKLFVHRVGRVARAGRTGTAYSLICPDEMSYLIDLHLFLGRSLNIARSGNKYENWDDLFGRVPQVVIDDENATLKIYSQEHDILNLSKVSGNAYKQYLRSRPAASSESIKRAKSILEDMNIGIHPAYSKVIDTSEELRLQLINSMKCYKPTNTIFEVGSTAKSSGFKAMQAARKQNEKFIEQHHKKKEEALKKMDDNSDRSLSNNTAGNSITSEEYHSLMGKSATEENSISDFVGNIRKRKASSTGTTMSNKKKKKMMKSFKDEDHYIPYKPKDHHTESGLSIDAGKSSFESQAAGAVLDLMGDDDASIRKQQGQRKVWDRKKKKFVQLQSGMAVRNGKIKTESGAIIKKSYKKNLYAEWKDKTKHDEQENTFDDEPQIRKGFNRKVGRAQASAHHGKRVKSELKKPHEILKDRKEKEKKAFQGHGKKGRRPGNQGKRPGHGGRNTKGPAIMRGKTGFGTKSSMKNKRPSYGGGRRKR